MSSANLENQGGRNGHFLAQGDPGQPGAANHPPKNYSQGVGLTLIIPSKSFGKVTLLFSGDGQTFFYLP